MNLGEGNGPGAGEPGASREPLIRVWLAAEGRSALALWCLLALVFVAVSAPLAAGARTLFLRDVLGIHMPLKAFGAAELAAGRIPAFDPALGLGQPFRGNPQALAFYPDNLLYLVAPFWSAFNLHFVLHWALALFGMRALARSCGQSRQAALCAGLTYAASGWFLSTLSLYNLVTVAALWPWVLLGARRGGARGVALGGLACGLALLGGEPVSAALGLLPLALVAGETHGWRRGAAGAAAIVGVGLLIALPQLVATARILPFTYRGAHGMAATEVYRFHPARLLELVLPLPFGWPGRGGALGWWALAIAPRLPLFFSVYAGVVGLWLAAHWPRARAAWAALALAGFGAAWLGGGLATVSGGLFRYPEKFLFWPALALPLLAGWGWDRVLAGGARHRSTAVAAAVFALAGAALLVLRLLAGESVAPLWRIQSLLWGLAALFAGVLLALAVRGVRRRSAALLFAAQALGLAQLWPLVASIPTAMLGHGAWAERVGAGASVANLALIYPRWDGLEGGLGLTPRAAAATLAAAPNVLSGLRYPLASDFEGMSSPLQDLLLINLARLSWPARARWLQALGVEHAVAFQDLALPGLHPVAQQTVDGAAARLFAVEEPAPDAWWPEQVTAAASPADALRAVSESADPVHTVVADRSIVQSPHGTVRLVSATPDRVELAVESGGGLAVVRRNFDPLWVARVDGLPARTVATNLVLLGVEVPPGAHRVVLEATAWPEAAAGIVALLVAAAAVALASRGAAGGLNER